MSKPGRPCYQKPLSAARKRIVNRQRKLQKREVEASLKATRAMHDK